MNISQMLSANARNYPDEVALVELAPGRKLRREITWSEFDRNANGPAFRAGGFDVEMPARAWGLSFHSRWVAFTYSPQGSFSL